MFVRDVIDRMWRRAVTNEGITARPCPDCRHRMIEVAATDHPRPRVEVCRTCHFVWFDADEMAAFRPLPAMTIQRRLPRKARELLAMARVEQLAREAQGDDWASDPPDAWWKSLAGLFGLPVEFDDRTHQRRPWATWSLAASIAILSFMAFPYLEETVRDLGLIPADAWRHGGATFLTAFFLHGGILHLAGNLYFLLVFGDDLEDYCGGARLLLLVLLATLVGDLAHIMTDIGSRTPCIGASGGISGIIVLYALRFPGARLGFSSIYNWQLRWIRFPAWFALILWTLLQIFGVWQQISGFSSVSAAAHLGGAFVGLCAWAISVRQSAE
jgi:membrane associated rhomboid family serine protease